MTTLIPRSQVPTEQTWNAESVYADRDAWRAEYDALARDIPTLAQHQGFSDAVSLLAYLEASQSLGRRVRTLFMYASLASSVDSSDDEARAMLGQAMGHYGQLASLTAFYEPHLLSLGRETVMDWMASLPALAIYRHHFDEVFRRADHTLSAEAEAVLGALSEVLESPYLTSSELANSDMKFPSIQTSQGQPFPLGQPTVHIALQDPDRALRQAAWTSYADSYLALQNTFASNYLANARTNVALARLRRFESVLHYKLFPQALPIQVFHNLMSVFVRHLPLWQRFWDVKRRVLGYETFHPWDIWAPMTAHEPQVPYIQSVEWIAAGLAPLGQDYVAALRRGCLEERWVDYAVNAGKRQGAFSSGSYDTHPFIMMSYEESLSGMSTLAHELGHSLHTYHTVRHQPPIYADYGMFVAETASNFNQAMTRAYLFQQGMGRDFELALIQEAIDNFHRYFFIMPTLARFELEVHTRLGQGRPLNAQALNAIMADLYAEGYGTTMSDDRERTAITWAQFPHLYEAFYTFQYATGISAAHALSEAILAGEAGAAERYLQFLCAGSSVPPLEALKLAGVDMTTPEPIERAFGVLARLIDRLEALIEPSA
ncbi:MAG: oligoendopeptidase F [Anaerolineae bacterium]|nr:oligoendopeptidase F [Anaerolineae bacterium]MDW8172247.1 oligoendopeptidase F [Anaerolineae bacterium]